MTDRDVHGARGNGRVSGNGRASGNGTGPSLTPGSGPRRLRHPWRFVIVAVGLLVAANLLWIAGQTADTSNRTRTLPSDVTAVLPAPGSQVRVQDTVTADLRPGLIGVLVIDGVELPENQVTRVVPLGEVSFRPGKGKSFERLEPGTHSVSIIYWPQTKTRADGTNTFTWSFSTG